MGDSPVQRSGIYMARETSGSESRPSSNNPSRWVCRSNCLELGSGMAFPWREAYFLLLPWFPTCFRDLETTDLYHQC